MPINFIVTDGSCADCKEVIHLIKNINAKLAFADCTCDTNEILSYLNQRNTKPVIHAKRDRLYQRGYKCFKVLKKRENSFIGKLYRLCYIIGNTLLAIKCWCIIATCCAQPLDTLISSVFVHHIFLLFWFQFYFDLSKCLNSLVNILDHKKTAYPRAVFFVDIYLKK